MTYPTFHEAAEELSRQATTRAGGAADRGGLTGFRNEPMGTADSGLSAIDNEFLSLNSGSVTPPPPRHCCFVGINMCTSL